MDSEFVAAVEVYPWISQDQKDSYLAFVQYARKFGHLPSLPIDDSVAFFCQKNHEAAQYWQETFAAYIGTLQNDFLGLREELKSALQRIEDLSVTLKNQTMLLETLTKGK